MGVKWGTIRFHLKGHQLQGIDMWETDAQMQNMLLLVLLSGYQSRSTQETETSHYFNREVLI